MAYFEKLNERSFRGRSETGKVTSRAGRAGAALLAVSALAGIAFTAVSAPPLGSQLDTPARSAGQKPGGVPENGNGPLPLNFVPGQWTWVGGSRELTGQTRHGVFGTKGIADPANVPGCRSGSVSWTDARGDLWLFGGNDFVAASGYAGRLNDLWRRSTSTGEWTWVSGSNGINQEGAYGTQGVAGQGNVPGARGASVSWTDGTGNLWLFGGYGYAATGIGYLSDFWKWDISSGVWTWVSGSVLSNASGSYGTQGVAAPWNSPVGRAGAVSWIDFSGNLWLFGGYVYAPGAEGLLNDLWKWDPSTGEWTWVSGSNQPNQHGAYGVKGIEARQNAPGARSGSVSWVDASGNLWLFGGEGYAASGGGVLNDLWKWNVSTGQWAWISGSNAPDQDSSYGTKGVAAPNNFPGQRLGPVSWTDNRGILWLFGGYATTDGGDGYKNDLWKWDISIREWTWVSGSNAINQVGTYGTPGVASPGSIPCSRYDSVSWIDASGNLWLFGGGGFTSEQSIGTLNDLWAYSICTAPSVPGGVPGSRFGTGAVVLWASGANGGQGYKWYAASRGGPALQTGSATFTTPSISASTNYYVSIYDAATGCESARTAVMATPVNPMDPLFIPVRRPRG